MDPTADRPSPEQALAIYAESLVPRGVVAVLGDSSAGVGELALRLGARSVHVWDPDEARARAQADAAPRGLTVRPLAREDLVRRDFDLAIIADLGLFDDPAGLLVAVRKMVGEEGVAVVAAPNGGAASAGSRRAFDYYALFDAVAAEFDFVRMVAQMPFRGVALVELGDETDASGAVSVDTQLGDEGGTPEVFVALGSQRDVRLDPYAIVQLPSIATPDAAEPAPPPEPTEEDRAALASLRERAARGDKASALEEALAERGRQVATLSRELDALRASVDAGRLAAAEELDELIARLDRAERRVAEQSEELRLSSRDEHAAEHAVLEKRLHERAQVIRDLELELVRRERLVRDLAGAIEDANGEAARGPAKTEQVEDLRRRLDALALDLARREGDAQAAAWSIQELERRLERAGGAGATGSPVAPDPAPRLARLDELEALRLALAQEHEARLRAESRSGSSAPPIPAITPGEQGEQGEQGDEER